MHIQQQQQRQHNLNFAEMMERLLFDGQAAMRFKADTNGMQPQE